MGVQTTGFGAFVLCRELAGPLRITEPEQSQSRTKKLDPRLTTAVASWDPGAHGLLLAPLCLSCLIPVSDVPLCPCLSTYLYTFIPVCVSLSLLVSPCLCGSVSLPILSPRLSLSAYLSMCISTSLPIS